MLHVLKNIYNKLPFERLGLLKNIPDRILFGKSYVVVRSSSTYGVYNLRKNLFNIISHARNTTKYGRDHIPENVSLDNVFDVYDNLPVISTDDVSSNIENFISDEASVTNSYYTTTGGTGRNPSKILLSNESFGKEWAHMHAIWSLIGYKRKQHCKLTLRGKHLDSEKLTQYNPIYNEVVVDTFRLSNENFSQFLNEIERWQISYIHGYPSLLFEFKNYLERAGVSFPVKGIMLGSEGASVKDKQDLEEFFGCKVIHWYGQTEKVILAPDIDGNGMFKCFTSYGYPDILYPVEGFGEIIGTTFVNRAMPLIKYRTGDFGKLERDGDFIFIKDLKGRWGKDFLYYSNDKKIPTSSVNLHSDIQKEILFYQIYQSDFAEIHIKILPRKTTVLSDEKIKNTVAKEIQDKLSGFIVTAEVTNNENDILRSKRGKMMMLVQDIKEV